MWRLLVRGVEAGILLTLIAFLSALSFSMVAGDVPPQGPWVTFWQVYLAILIFLPAAFVLRLFNWVEAFGDEGFKALAEDLATGEEGPSEKLYNQLRAFKGNVYRFLIKISLLWAVLVGFYAGVGLRLSASSGWVSLFFALLPLVVLSLVLWIIWVYRGFKRTPVMLKLWPLLGGASH